VRIETATIRRLRDALLESGRRESAVLSPAYETLARAGLLSDDERTDLARVAPAAEAMFLVMAADGKVTESEREAVRGALRGLTDNRLHDGTLKVLLNDFEGALASEGRTVRLQRLGAALAKQPSDAERAFALAAAVALADDEVAPEERHIVKELAQWFGITAERATAILEQLEEDRLT
jgi:uncharacterized tellurite resistance protein B-like protein